MMLAIDLIMQGVIWSGDHYSLDEPLSWLSQ
ncbi:hypothetical protein JD844_011709, partial [Phrynosoma platyrhinos]